MNEFTHRAAARLTEHLVHLEPGKISIFNYLIIIFNYYKSSYTYAYFYYVFTFISLLINEHNYYSRILYYFRLINWNESLNAHFICETLHIFAHSIEPIKHAQLFCNYQQ